MTRICKLCKLKRDIKYFRLMHNKKYNRDYYQCYCIECEKKYQKEHRKEKNVNENYKSYQKKYRLNNKEKKNMSKILFLK